MNELIWCILRPYSAFRLFSSCYVIVVPRSSLKDSRFGGTCYSVYFLASILHMNEPHGGSDDPRNTEIFIAGLSYWTSHRDLDTFNSETLVSRNLTRRRVLGARGISFNPYAFQIRSLVAMTPHNEPHLWSPRLGVLFNEFKEEVPVHDGGVDSHQAAVYFRRSAKGRIVRTMVRQAESVFNLSQLMFALYHGQTQASTFRDLNDNRELNAQHTIQGGCHFGVTLSTNFCCQNFKKMIQIGDPRVSATTDQEVNRIRFRKNQGRRK